MPDVTGRVALAATLFVFQSVLSLVPAAAQEAMEKKSYNYSAWTPGIFSEAVTITNMGKGKFIFLAGIGAEDENGPRGAIRHRGDFAAQCANAYDKIKRALAANGSSLKESPICATVSIGRSARAKPSRAPRCRHKRCWASASSPFPK